MSLLEDLRSSLERNAPRHVDELSRLISVPSVSAQGQGIEEAANVVASLLADRDLDVEICETDGFPVVVGVGGNPAGPTMLFYEHYDVQPPEPFELWTHPPFELTVSDGRYYGRGVADTKGTLIARLAAVDAVRDVLGEDVVNYKFLIEGEEEIGSPSLAAFIDKNSSRLAADACMWEFGHVNSKGVPQISIGLKGIATYDMRCKVASRDAHSSLGAVIENPLYRLACAVASLRDATGQVLVDGFYDDVAPLSSVDESILAASADPTAELLSTYGLSSLLVSGQDVVRRLDSLPCINVNGFTGGYGGSGSKTVLPSAGLVKLDVRLVPDMTPGRVTELLRAHLNSLGFADITLELLSGQPAGRTSPSSEFVTLVRDAAREVYGCEPAIQLSNPGSGPAYPFAAVLGVPFACLGIGYEGSQVHSPDEHVRIEDFEKGKLHSAMVLAEFGKRRW